MWERTSQNAERTQVRRNLVNKQFKYIISVYHQGSRLIIHIDQYKLRWCWWQVTGNILKEIPHDMHNQNIHFIPGTNHTSMYRRGAGGTHNWEKRMKMIFVLWQVRMKINKPVQASIDGCVRATNKPKTIPQFSYSFVLYVVCCDNIYCIWYVCIYPPFLGLAHRYICEHQFDTEPLHRNHPTVYQGSGHFHCVRCAMIISWPGIYVWCWCRCVAYVRMVENNVSFIIIYKTNVIQKGKPYNAFTKRVCNRGCTDTERGNI